VVAVLSFFRVISYNVRETSPQIYKPSHKQIVLSIIALSTQSDCVYYVDATAKTRSLAATKTKQILLATRVPFLALFRGEKGCEHTRRASKSRCNSAIKKSTNLTAEKLSNPNISRMLVEQQKARSVHTQLRLVRSTSLPALHLYAKFLMQDWIYPGRKCVSLHVIYTLQREDVESKTVGKGNLRALGREDMQRWAWEGKRRGVH